MRPLYIKLSTAAVMAVLALSGCGKKPDVKTEASDLEKAFPAAVAAAPAPSNTPSPAQAQAPNADAYVKAALLAVSADDYAGGVIALQAAQRMSGVNAEQLMAIERTKQAMTASLLDRAGRGDAKAKADLSRIEKTHSQ